MIDGHLLSCEISTLKVMLKLKETLFCCVKTQNRATDKFLAATVFKFLLLCDKNVIYLVALKIVINYAESHLNVEPNCCIQ